MAGRVAIVTGGARGIGGASAIEFASRGADVVIGDILPREKAADTINKIEALGRRVAYVEGDLRRQEGNIALVDAAVKQFGRVDYVLCNAGAGLRRSFVELSAEDAHRIFELIFWAGYYLSQAAAKRMIEQGSGGSIVFISSVHSARGYANAVAYNAAKAAVNHMARTIALELAPHKIRANWIEPGWIDTPGERILFGDKMVDEGGQHLLWGRLGKPEEIADGVAYLCEGDYITGYGLRIDGGYTLPRPT